MPTGGNTEDREYRLNPIIINHTCSKSNDDRKHNACYMEKRSKHYANKSTDEAYEKSVAHQSHSDGVGLQIDKAARSPNEPDTDADDGGQKDKDAGATYWSNYIAEM